MSRRSDYGQVPKRKRGEKTVSETLCLVQQAAQRLVRELRRAEVWTVGWSNRQLAAGLLDAALRRCLTTLASSNCWGTSNETLSHELWRIAGDWLKRGWLQSRIREKPCGYPEDYELLQRIHDQTVCPDPLGRTFDDFFLKQAGAHALRQRSEFLASEISRCYLRRNPDTFHVLSFGCGPATELQRFIQQISLVQHASLRLTLVDPDTEALNKARLRFHGQVERSELVLCQENLYRMPERYPDIKLSAPVDFLICGGLFNYLSDAAARQMLAFLFGCLASRGRMLIGNFSPHNPTRAYWEWIGNWYLNHRDQDSMRRIARDAGIAASDTRLLTDASGVILFLDITRGETG